MVRPGIHRTYSWVHSSAFIPIKVDTADNIPHGDFTRWALLAATLAICPGLVLAPDSNGLRYLVIGDSVRWLNV